MSDKKADMRAVLDHLQGRLAEGYLLHGSKQRSELLEPRRAWDTDPSNLVGNQTAIYAARNLRIPIVMALIAIKDGSTAWLHEYSDDGKAIYLSGTNFTFTPGFVYVLPADGFVEIRDEQGRTDIVSFGSVIPAECMCVTPDILHHLNHRIDEQTVAPGSGRGAGMSAG